MGVWGWVRKTRRDIRVLSEGGGKCVASDERIIAIFAFSDPKSTQITRAKLAENLAIFAVKVLLSSHSCILSDLTAENGHIVCNVRRGTWSEKGSILQNGIIRHIHGKRIDQAYRVTV